MLGWQAELTLADLPWLLHHPWGGLHAPMWLAALSRVEWTFAHATLSPVHCELPEACCVSHSALRPLHMTPGVHGAWYHGTWYR